MTEIKWTKNLKSETFYNDLYDRMTVEDCRGFEKRFVEGKDLPKINGKPMPPENQESLKKALVTIPLYIKKGQHYENKSETIRKWQQRDKEKDEKIENAKAPDGVMCLKCGKEMTCTMKELHDDDSGEEQVLFSFRCLDCNKIRMIYESGREFVPKPMLCQKCRTEMTHRSSRRNQVVESVYNCPKCEHQEIFTVDLAEKEPAIDKDFEADRKRFCLTDEEGGNFISGMMNLERVDELMKKVEKKEKEGEIRYLNITEVEKLLVEALEKEDYYNFKLDSPEFNKDVFVGFTAQDKKTDRQEYDSKQGLKKLIEKTLVGTNWKLMSEGIDYRLGFLGGRIRGSEKRE